jgi:hypothetical protein
VDADANALGASTDSSPASAVSKTDGRVARTTL